MFTTYTCFTKSSLEENLKHQETLNFGSDSFIEGIIQTKFRLRINLFLEFEKLRGVNSDGQMISNFIGADVERWRDMLQPIVICFSARKFLQDVILAVLEVIARLVHADHYIVNSHEEAQQDVKAGWHDALKIFKLIK